MLRVASQFRQDYGRCSPGCVAFRVASTFFACAPACCRFAALPLPDATNDRRMKVCVKESQTQATCTAVGREGVHGSAAAHGLPRDSQAARVLLRLHRRHRGVRLRQRSRPLAVSHRAHRCVERAACDASNLLSLAHRGPVISLACCLHSAAAYEALSLRVSLCCSPRCQHLVVFTAPAVPSQARQITCSGSMPAKCQVSQTGRVNEVVLPGSRHAPLDVDASVSTSASSQLIAKHILL